MRLAWQHQMMIMVRVPMMYNGLCTMIWGLPGGKKQGIQRDCEVT